MIAPLRRIGTLTDGAPLAPLLILFGLNAVDELDRSAFNVLLPDIRDHFGLDNEGILAIIGAITAVALGLQPVIGYWADRLPRVRLALLGAGAWAFFSIGTGLAPALALLVIARIGSGLGRLVNDPTHNSLLADYYPPDSRVKVYGAHRLANPFGLAVGPLLAGVLAHFFGWRAPFFVFAVPTAVLIVVAARTLREPVRGMHERRAHGASEEAIATEEVPPSFAESWRICYQVRTLRRIWMAMPFVAGALIGVGSLTNLFYEDVFDLNAAERGVIGAITEPFAAIGILVGLPIATRLSRRDEGLVVKMLAVAGVIVAVAIVGFALAPNLGTAVAMHIVLTSVLGVLPPGILATLSLAIPPRARALGFSIGGLYVLPGVIVLLIIGGIADGHGIRIGMLVLAPIFLFGAFLLASAGAFVRADVAKVRASAAAQAEVLAARRRGESKLLLVKELDVAYDGVQVLFGVDFEVDAGEMVALLGTNGAGKSTLLKAISGLVEADAGAIVFDGRDMTYAPPHEIAARGVVQVPGGKGVFPTLTVAENLRLAGWLFQRDAEHISRSSEEIRALFPALVARWDEPAGNLSGGEQQMLALSMAFVAQPRLLMIDELSLGLAPVVVEQLVQVVRSIRDRGTTVIVVEQSVNVALTLADTAYFMEKGEIRFHGRTAELLERPDILRSVFLEGMAEDGPTPKGRRRVAPIRPGPDAVDAAVILEAQDVVKHWGGIVAVDGADISLREGTILGLIGPNGAGKTTLFDIISGFVVPDAGRVVFDGVDITRLPPDQRAWLGLGRSFQDTFLVPPLTVAENIAIALERHLELRDHLASALSLPDVLRVERDVAWTVEDLIELMNLGAFRDKFVAELSTGSRRVVNLAMCMAHDPRVLLLDEPSAGIAQREAEALAPLLRRIQREVGCSMLVIEHDMPLISSISDEMVCLVTGRTVARGRPDEVVNDPVVVASYLGTDANAIGRSGPPAPTSRSRATARSRAGCGR